MGVTFILSVAFANLVSQETYGTYKYILSMYGLLSIATLPGLGTALLQSVASGYEGSVNKVLKTKIKWGLFGSLGSLVISGYYFFNGNSNLGTSFLIIAPFFPFMDSFDLYGAILSGRKDFKNLTRYTILPQIIVSMILISALFFIKKAYLLVIVYLTAWTLVRFITLKITLKNHPLNDKVDSGIISYGKNLTMMNVLDHFASYADRLFVFLFVGPVELAVYSIAIAPSEQVKTLLSQLNDLMFPRMAARNDEEIKAGMNNKYIKLFILGGTVIIIYILLAPYFFHMFFPKYEESILLSQVFSISMLNVAAVPTNLYLLARKRVKELYKSNVMVSVFQILSMAILTYFMGLWGLVLARVATRFFSPFVSIYYYNKTVGEDS